MNNKNIFVGFADTEKTTVISQYLTEHPEVTNVVYFTHDKRTPLDLAKMGVPVEYRTWSDAIKYRYFYPLVEKINDHYLIVYDEMMRTKNRNDLTYNCCHHYSNQTPHNLEFQRFPLMIEQDDFMILVDLAFPNVYKGKPFEAEYLKLGIIRDRMVEIDNQLVWKDGSIPESIQEAYNEERDMLFDDIGDKDPDTIPRTLHIWCGTNCKKGAVKEIKEPMLARNARFKAQNVGKWTDFTPAKYIIDFPVRQMQFNDYCMETGVNKFIFLDSGLSADKCLLVAYRDWAERLGEMYVTASISA